MLKMAHKMYQDKTSAKIHFSLLIIIKAAITPGTHPAKVSKKTIRIDPQP